MPSDAIMFGSGRPFLNRADQRWSHASQQYHAMIGELHSSGDVTSWHPGHGIAADSIGMLMPGNRATDMPWTRLPVLPA